MLRKKKIGAGWERSLKNTGDSSLKHAFPMEVKITKGVKSSLGEAKKKRVDIMVVCDPPNGHHTKTDMQCICGINISWQRRN